MKEYEKTTLEYYNRDAKMYFDKTVQKNMSRIADGFLEALPEGAEKILDLGCGSGRDLKYFAEKGYDVLGVDGSEELCALAKEYAGCEVQHLTFDNLREMPACGTPTFDGVWACASLLHLSDEELSETVKDVASLLKPGGVLYTCFKLGTEERLQGLRFYNDKTTKTAPAFFATFDEFVMEECYTSGDVREGCCAENWVNVLLRRK